MNVFVGNTMYQLERNVREAPARRAAFCALAQEVFSLDFASWQENGWWTGKYRPYTLFDGEKAVANVSANTMAFRLYGEQKRFLQLGTVMTAPEYRGRGLSRFLLERVLEEEASSFDLTYLYANDTVLDFYPKFGFQKAEEADFFLRAGKAPAAKPRRLRIDRKADLQLLLSCYGCSNPFSACVMEENPGLLMFYCGGFLQNYLWYLEKERTVLIAERDEEGWLCWDVFGSPGCSLPALLAALPGAEGREVRLGFLPYSLPGVEAKPRNEADETLFVQGKDRKIFQREKVLFPLLSHA